MGILEFTILFAAIFNLGAGIFVYSRGRLKKINLLFALSGLITSSWVFSNFMTGMQPNHFWLKSAYALGALVPVSDLIWVLVLCDKKITKITNILLITTGLFFFGASYINNLILTDIKKVYLGGFEGGTGFLYPLYSAYMIAISLVVVYNLLLKFYKSQGTEKIQISYILIGGILYISSVLIVSFILPLFKILDFIPLDSPSSLFLLFFTALAITRYHLFQIKIILTEALVVSMAIILTILPFLMPSGSLKILTSIVLGLFLIFGFLLIKATHAEVRRKEEAERLLKAKTEFLSIASHQLRTPLTAIIGYSSMLKEGDYGRLPKEASEAIKHINDSSQRMIKLVNDFLSVSRLETGRTVLKKRDFSLNELIEQVVSGLKLKAKEKNLYLEYEKQKNDKIIKMDPEKLKEAISNLIDNSIHYTERGGITVSSKTTNSKIIITISDTGVGMSRQEISALFESFSRGKAGNELNTQGSGLGLYIAKKFVEMHNGRIWAESEGKDKGSFFHIEIPNK